MANQQPTRIKNLSITSIIALTGCVPLVVVFAALFVGLWIDVQVGQRGPGIICSLAASLPISLYLMTRLALYLVSKLQPAPPQNDATDDAGDSDART